MCLYHSQSKGLSACFVSLTSGIVGQALPAAPNEACRVHPKASQKPPGTKGGQVSRFYRSDRAAPSSQPTKRAKDHKRECVAQHKLEQSRDSKHGAPKKNHGAARVGKPEVSSPLSTLSGLRGGCPAGRTKQTHTLQPLHCLRHLSSPSMHTRQGLWSARNWQ